MASAISTKLVLITGGAGGIGGQLARRFADAGCRVVLWDRDESALAQVTGSVPGDVQGFAVDIAVPEQVSSRARELLDSRGCPDILVNNAGVLHQGLMADLDEPGWERLMGINFDGARRVTEAFLPAMRDRRSGQIVNIASGQVFWRLPTYAAYTVSKAALAYWSEALSRELRREGITVTTVYPFAVRTGLYDGIEPPTAFGRFLLRLMGVFGWSPETAGKRIYRAIRRRRRRYLGGVLNLLGILVMGVPGVASGYQRLAARLLLPPEPKEEKS